MMVGWMGRCAACRAVVDDIKFVFRSSALAQLTEKAMRARWLDLQLLLDDICQDGLTCVV